jgi:hypothetical protein
MRLQQIGSATEKAEPGEKKVTATRLPAGAAPTVVARCERCNVRAPEIHPDQGPVSAVRRSVGDTAFSVGRAMEISTISTGIRADVDDLAARIGRWIFVVLPLRGAPTACVYSPFPSETERWSSQMTSGCRPSLLIRNPTAHPPSPITLQSVLGSADDVAIIDPTCFQLVFVDARNVPRRSREWKHPILTID